MSKEDIAQVAEIDREAFPTQWPPPNFQNELRNRMVYYRVACDDNKSPAQSSSGTTLLRARQKLASWLGHLFSNNRSPETGLFSPDEHYITGFVGCWVMAGEAHITTIAVREACRRRGIGELLLISAIDLAMELKASNVTLEVRVSNTGAQNLYFKYGFVRMGVRRGYYTDNHEDAIVMSTENIASASFQARLKQLKQAYSGKWGIDLPQVTHPKGEVA